MNELEELKSRIKNHADNLRSDYESYNLSEEQTEKMKYAEYLLRSLLVKPSLTEVES